jgi:hypothetical protein
MEIDGGRIFAANLGPDNALVAYLSYAALVHVPSSMHTHGTLPTPT